MWLARDENCSNCGAGLPAGDPGVVMRCPFCGTENRIAPAPPIAPPVERQPEPESPEVVSPPEKPLPKGSGTGCALFGIVAVVLIGGLILATRSNVKSSLTGTKVADLHTSAIVWTANTPIDAPPIVSSLDHFDALANIDWAKDVAHGWWSDAELQAIEIDPVAKNGSVNLTVASAHATWEFFSAGCVADHQKRAETTPNLPENTCQLTVTVASGGPYVSMRLSGAHDPKPITRPACTLAEVFARLTQDNKLQTRPSYSARLENDGEPYWQIRAGQGATDLDAPPDIHAEFCKGTKPYRY